MKKLKLIEVGGTTCGVCKMMKPMVDKAISQFGEELEFIYIYGDTESGQEEMKVNGITNVSLVPSFFFIQDGEIKDTISGGLSLPTFVSKIKTYL